MDEVLCYQQTVGGIVARYYPHYNHLYSVAALTNSAGQVVERFSYDAYGKQKITDASGNVTRAKSAVGWDRGFTGYIVDQESSLLHARARQYSPGLGRFVGRDPLHIAPYEPMVIATMRPIRRGLLAYVGEYEGSAIDQSWPYRLKRSGPRARDGYSDGYLLYGAYFVPNGVDPTGLEFEWCNQCNNPTFDNCRMGIVGWISVHVGSGGNYVKIRVVIMPGSTCFDPDNCDCCLINANSKEPGKLVPRCILKGPKCAKSGVSRLPLDLARVLGWPKNGTTLSNPTDPIPGELEGGADNYPTSLNPEFDDLPTDEIVPGAPAPGIPQVPQAPQAPQAPGWN